MKNPLTPVSGPPRTASWPCAPGRSRITRVAIARQRAENDLADLQRTQKERMAGLDRLAIARHGPVRHVATALVVPATDAPRAASRATCSTISTRKSTARARSPPKTSSSPTRTRAAGKCERVGHLKIGFDIRSLGPADPQTGYRDPVTSIRRIEVKGRKRGQPIRLTTNEWYKAIQLGDSYWLYVVWDPLGKPRPEPLRIQNPAKHLDHAKKEVVAARYFDIPAEQSRSAPRQATTSEGGE